jgi:glycosyltransferase involved in cell wall biosynthesis
MGMAAYTGLLADAGYPVSVYSVGKKNDGESVRLDSRVRHNQEARAGWGSFRRCPALWRQTQATAIDLVHSHGLWTDVNRLAADIARRRGLPHLLAPCGMLAPGALHRHWWKKLPVRFWFQDRALREARCLHAKSRQEYEGIRRYGLRSPVAIIANPIPTPPQLDMTSAEDFRRAGQIPADRKIVLFLGRLHRVKGLVRLVRAWAALRAHYPAWVLVLAGPDEGGHRREIESLGAWLDCEGSVLFAGELNDQQKWAALAAADLFVMPSDFENFGNAIVEAMSCAVPVITTTGTPWDEVQKTGAGWWVEPVIEELTVALRNALGMSEDQRRAMGRRAFQLAERFRPGRIAEDLIQVYQWLLCGSARPSCVKVD